MRVGVAIDSHRAVRMDLKGIAAGSKSVMVFGVSYKEAIDLT